MIVVVLMFLDDCDIPSKRFFASFYFFSSSLCGCRRRWVVIRLQESENSQQNWWSSLLAHFATWGRESCATTSGYWNGGRAEHADWASALGLKIAQDGTHLFTIFPPWVVQHLKCVFNNCIACWNQPRCVSVKGPQMSWDRHEVPLCQRNDFRTDWREQTKRHCIAAAHRDSRLMFMSSLPVASQVQHGEEVVNGKEVRTKWIMYMHFKWCHWITFSYDNFESFEFICLKDMVMHNLKARLISFFIHSFSPCYAWFA